MNNSDIKFYHSGGGFNCNPQLDLGGTISSCLVADGLNGLFDDIGSVQSRNGLIDYRCFYIKNTHADESLRNAIMYIDSERSGGSFIDLGVTVRDEIQTITVTGPYPPNEGETMTLEVPNYGQFTVKYHINRTIWQGNFQSEIRGLDGLNDVIVSIAGVIGAPTQITFTVKFTGDAGSRDLDLITLVSNGMTGTSVAFNEMQKGSPINTTACGIGSVINSPACVNFSYPLRGNPVVLGALKPDDAFPVWVRRTTPENTLIFLLDDFRINIDGAYP